MDINKTNKNIREKETLFIKESLKTKNIIITGDKGIGKTTIIKQAIGKKLVSINMKNIEYSNSIYNEVSLKGKIYLLKEKFFNNFITVLTSFLSINSIVLAFVGYTKTKENVLSITFTFSPLILFIFISFLMWFLNFIFQNFWNKKIIHFHELNFIETENKKNMMNFIWKIYSIYSNNRIIFEADHIFPLDLQYKFNLRKINLFKNEEPRILINDLVKRLWNNSLTKIDKDITKDLSFHIKNNYDVIREIILKLTYREVDNIVNDFEYSHRFLKGEINFLDFILIRFIELKHSDIYKFLIDEQKYSNMIKKEENDDKKNFLTMIGGLNNNVLSYYIESNLPNNNLFIFDNEPSKNNYSFFNYRYRNAYLLNFDYYYLEKDLIDIFLKNPLLFMKEITKKKIYEIEFLKYLNDQEIIKFYDEIEKHNWKDLFKIMLLNDSFLFGNPFNNMRISIMKTRKDKQEFYNLLPKKYKIYFFASYINYMDMPEQKKEFKKLGEIKIEDLPKNLFLSSPKINNKITLYNNFEFAKHFIKRRNILFVLNFFHSYSAFYLIGKNNNDYHKFFRISFDQYSENEIKFLIECFDKCNDQILKNNKWKIKKINIKGDEWIEISDNILNKYRN